MAVKTVKATINGQTYDLTLNEQTGKYEAVLTAPADSSFNLDGGYYPVSVEVEDTAGNKTRVDSTHATFGENLKLFVEERNKPVITILEPTDGSKINNTNKPKIKFQIVDNTIQTTGYSGVNKSSVVLKINNETVDSSKISWEDTSGGYIGTYTPENNLANGSCTISVEGSDNDGNAATAVSATFKIDTAKPTLIVELEDGYETNESTLKITGSTNDEHSKPVTIGITVNGVDQGEVTVNEDGTFNKNVELNNNGNNEIVITATDSVGLVTTVTKNVIYNTNDPVIHSIDIEPNTVDAGKTYTITVEVTAD